jgi:hypothetical protein
MVYVTSFNAVFVLLAPYSSYGRIVTTMLQPIYIGINNMLALWSEANDNYMYYQVEQHNNPMILIVVAVVTAIILLVLAFKMDALTATPSALLEQCSATSQNSLSARYALITANASSAVFVPRTAKHLASKWKKGCL